MDNIEEVIEHMVEDFTLEEVFEMVNITPEEALHILWTGGHIEIPEFLLVGELEEDE